MYMYMYIQMYIHVPTVDMLKCILENLHCLLLHVHVHVHYCNDVHRPSCDRGNVKCMYMYIPEMYTNRMSDERHTCTLYICPTCTCAMKICTLYTGYVFIGQIFCIG